MTFKTNSNTRLLSEQLKLETQANHLQVEKLLMSKIRGVHGISEYVHLLGVFYGYFGAAEELLQRFIDKEMLADIESRRKAENILTDIRYFNGGFPQLAIKDELPEIDSHLKAFGMLYVLEGSTLGGAIISRVLQKQLQQEGGQGFSFFNGYGAGTESMWQNFKDALDTGVSNSGTDNAVVIASANSTFLLFGNWIEKNYPAD